MKNLPVEIIEHLLTYDDLEIKDILNFSETCTHFREILCNNNPIWKSFYIRRYV